MDRPQFSSDFAREARGPIVIIGRPHSGTRMLARFCIDHGVFLGDDMAPNFLDSVSWYQRFVVPLLTSRHFPDATDRAPDEDLLQDARKRLDETWPLFRRDRDARPFLAWGWKFPETLFLMPLVKRLFPSARFLHVVRDVRDVCLSDNGFFQLTGGHADPPGWSPGTIDGVRPRYVEFCTAVTFGRRHVEEWRRIDLRDRAVLARNRFLIQAQSWVTCVRRAQRHGEALGEDYLQVRYEDFCRSPGAEADRILSFVGAQRSTATEASLARIMRGRLERWRHVRLSLHERRDLAAAADLAGSLARELGYAL